MKTLIAFITIFATACASSWLYGQTPEKAEQPPKLQWQPFTSAYGRFTANFPGEVMVEQEANVIHAHASPPDVDADFRITYTDRAAADADADASYTELERIRKAIADSQGIEPQNIVKFMSGPYPSMVFNYTMDVEGTKAHYRVWYLIDGRRFYQISYGYPAEKRLQDEGELFFKSFKIIRE
jgi:hypothetical protein